MRQIVMSMFILISLSASIQAQDMGLGVESLDWLAGHRVHTTSSGAKVFEAFIGPINGVLTGTALSGIGSDQASTEYHKFGPNEDGRYGLAVANTRSGMVWNFTPLASIEEGRITFRSDNGALTISYFALPDNGVGAFVERIVDGESRRSEYTFLQVRD